MIVPEFWAEARIHQRVQDRQYTVRRFGWSDESQEAAQAHAEVRTREAFDRIVAGEKAPRRERKVPYNGADGMPIREEIVSRHGNAVITRNSYGARCLNTPDILMADVDFEKPAPGCASCIVTLVLGTAAFLTGVFTHSSKRGALYAVVALFAAPLFVWLVNAVRSRLRGGREGSAHRKFDRFASDHPDWRLRLYRTPAGFRVMVTHRLFDPLEDDTTRLFEALDSDKIYVRMCRNQRCFRARLTPKPWRAGIPGHVMPRTTWPVAPEYLPGRTEWIATYEDRARDFAACHFLLETGTDTEHPAASAVRELHDEICQAHTDLPLA